MIILFFGCLDEGEVEGYVERECGGRDREKKREKEKGEGGIRMEREGDREVSL